MCGVLYHAADSYIARLIQRDYRVAILRANIQSLLVGSVIRKSRRESRA